MSGCELLQSVQFVTVKEKRFAVIDAEDWEAFVDWLEEVEDRHIMSDISLPVEYQNWRANATDRTEDAAYIFGYYLIMHCRDEAMATLATDTPPEITAAVEKALDVALHNVCDLLEGFWRLEAGPKHTVSLALHVQVRDENNNVAEVIDISPCKLDLPIGYWKWAHDREFR